MPTDDLGVVFRGTSTRFSPDVLKSQGGMRPRGHDTNLYEFLEANEPSYFVSTSRDAEEAISVASKKPGGGYLYDIDPSSGRGIDVRDIFGGPEYSNMAAVAEKEVTFQGAGVISECSLELFSDLPANNVDPTNPDFGKALRQFDYGTISDAILHVKYTAREDAGVFKNGAIANLRIYFNQDGATPALRMFSLRQEFPTQWSRFLNPTDPANGNIFELEMSSNLFPIRDAEKTLKVNTIWLLARCTDPGSYEVVMTPPLPLPPPDDTMTLTPVNQYGGLHFSQKGSAQDPLGIEIVPSDPPVKWQLTMTRPGGGNLQDMEVKDVLLVFGYEWADS